MSKHLDDTLTLIHRKKSNKPLKSSNQTNLHRFTSMKTNLASERDNLYLRISSHPTLSQLIQMAPLRTIQTTKNPRQTMILAARAAAQWKGNVRKVTQRRNLKRAQSIRKRKKKKRRKTKKKERKRKARKITKWVLSYTKTFTLSHLTHSSFQNSYYRLL